MSITVFRMVSVHAWRWNGFEGTVWRRTVNLRLACASRFTSRFSPAVLADLKQAATVVEEIAIHRPHQH